MKVLENKEATKNFNFRRKILFDIPYANGADVAFYQIHDPFGVI